MSILQTRYLLARHGVQMFFFFFSAVSGQTVFLFSATGAILAHSAVLVFKAMAQK